jgi:hypothetical protein
MGAMDHVKIARESEREKRGGIPTIIDKKGRSLKKTKSMNAQTSDRFLPYRVAEANNASRTVLLSARMAYNCHRGSSVCRSLNWTSWSK